MYAKAGDTVKVHYVGKLEDNTIFENSKGRQPLQFTMGENKVIAGFEEGVLGMAIGEKREIFISSDKAYGPYREELVVSIPKEQLPEDITFEKGLKLMMPSSEGDMVPVVIKDVLEDKIVIDANSELAGKNLIFEVELVEII
jgi:peptidylprolyl isomerase